MFFILMLFSGLNCHNRPAESAKPVTHSTASLNWNDIKITSNNIDSNLSMIEALCSNLETTAVKKKIPARQLIELVVPNGTQQTFIFNDTTNKK